MNSVLTAQATADEKILIFKYSTFKSKDGRFAENCRGKLGGNNRFTKKSVSENSKNNLVKTLSGSTKKFVSHYWK